MIPLAVPGNGAGIFPLIAHLQLFLLRQRPLSCQWRNPLSSTEMRQKIFFLPSESEHNVDFLSVPVNTKELRRYDLICKSEGNTKLNDFFGNTCILLITALAQYFHLQHWKKQGTAQHSAIHKQLRRRWGREGLRVTGWSMSESIQWVMAAVTASVPYSSQMMAFQLALPTTAQQYVPAGNPVPCVELSAHKRVERMEGKSFRRRRQVASRFGLLSIASLAIAFGMRS